MISRTVELMAFIRNLLKTSPCRALALLETITWPHSNLLGLQTSGIQNLKMNTLRVHQLFKVNRVLDGFRGSSLVLPIPHSQYHTTKYFAKKHKNTKRHLENRAFEPNQETLQDDEEELELDAIFSSQDEAIEDVDPPPLGGHRFLVIQPKMQLKNSKHHSRSSDPELQLEESISLIETIPDWKVLEGLIQPTKEPAKKTVFGKGSYATLTELIRSRPEITAVFVSMERLSALQLKELEESWGVRVYDRYGVVLMIFREHARTKEAKLQIALAEIPYLRSRLRIESADMDQQRGGHSFISGGGETYLTVQQRVMQEREQKIRKALDRLKMKRNLLRSGRARRSFPVVAVVGYTNAGKTTLIKALTGDSTMHPKDQLFATLDVTAHGGVLPNRMPVIYIDTVGFISALPHTLVASFSATLEDVLLSDIIIHIRDISHPDTSSQKQNVLRVLTEMGVSDALMDSTVEVCNKMDKLEGPVSDVDLDTPGIMVSATKGTGLERLKECIQERLLETTDTVSCQLEIPMSGSQLSWLYKEATVTSAEAAGSDIDTQTMIVDVVMSTAAFSKFRAKFGDLRKIGKG